MRCPVMYHFRIGSVKTLSLQEGTASLKNCVLMGRALAGQEGARRLEQQERWEEGPPGSAGVPPACTAVACRSVSLGCGTRPPSRRERHRPGRSGVPAPLPVELRGGVGRGGAKTRAGGTPALPGGSLRSLRGAAVGPCHSRCPKPCHFQCPLTSWKQKNGINFLKQTSLYNRLNT